MRAIRLQINPINLRRINHPLPPVVPACRLDDSPISAGLFLSLGESCADPPLLRRIATPFRVLPFFVLAAAASLVKRFLPKDSTYLKNIKVRARPLSDTFVLCYDPVSTSQRSSLENKLSASVFHRTPPPPLSLSLSLSLSLVRREKFVILRSAVRNYMKCLRNTRA